MWVRKNLVGRPILRVNTFGRLFYPRQSYLEDKGDPFHGDHPDFVRGAEAMSDHDFRFWHGHNTPFPSIRISYSYSYFGATGGGNVYFPVTSRTRKLPLRALQRKAEQELRWSAGRGVFKFL